MSDVPLRPKPLHSQTHNDREMDSEPRSLNQDASAQTAQSSNEHGHSDDQADKVGNVGQNDPSRPQAQTGVI